MDALDIAIVRAMGIRPFGPTPQAADALRASHIARELGTTHVTVKERLARLEEAGLIAGYQIYPNLRHLGLASSAFLCQLRDEATKATRLRAVEEMEGAFEVHDFVGGGACIDLTHAGAEGLSRRLAELRERTADDQPRALYVRAMPAVSRRLERLDWRVLQALRGKAKRPPAEVADELGLSLRTVRRRCERMAREGSFFVVPMLDLSRARGIVPFFLNAYTDGPPDPATERAFLAAFHDRRLMAYRPEDPTLGNVGLMVFARSVADMEEMRERAAALPGVVRATAWVLRGWKELSGWLDAAIAERAAGRAQDQTASQA